MCGGTLENESRDIESHQQELTMISNLVPFIAAEDTYRRDRARQHFVAVARRRESRRARRNR
jgi:hypothetical protein